MALNKFPAVLLFGAFSAGILLWHFAGLSLVSAIVAAVVAIIGCVITLHVERFRPFQLPALILLFATLGATSESINRPFGFENVTKGNVLRGHVNEIIHYTSTDKVNLKITDIVDKEGNLTPASFPLTLLINDFPANRGSSVLLHVNSEVSDRTLPEKNELTIYADSSDITLLDPQSSSTLREKIEDTISSSGLSPSAKGLVNALTTGDRNAISGTVSEDYAKAGIIHILAISGLHIGIVGAMLYIIFLPLALIKRQLPLWLTIAGIWGFVILTGGAVSAVRAAIMFTIGGFAVMMQRQSNPINTLAVAGLVIVALNPSDLFSPGFQMSFGAVLLIILCSSLPDRIVSRHHRPKTYWLLSLVTASIAAQLATLPLTAYYFHTVSLLSLPLNLLVIAIIPVIVWCSMVYVVLLCLGVDLMPLRLLIDTMADLLGRGASFMATSTLNIEGIWIPTIVVLLAMVMVIVLACAVRKPESLTRWTIASILTVATSAALLILPDATPEDSVEIFPSGGDIAMRQMTRGMESYSVFPPETPTEADIMGKRVILVNHKLDLAKPQSPKKCDILLLGTSFRTAVKELLDHYTPGMIVIAGSQASNRTARLTADCDSLAVPRLLITREAPLRLTYDKAAQPQPQPSEK